MITQFKQKDTSLSKEAQKNWMFILSDTYEFD